MDPQWHDEFKLLCSLYPSGELTEEEWALLQIHLAYCESCTILFEQYQHLAKDVMPALAAQAFLESESEQAPLNLDDAEARLMRALDDRPVLRGPDVKPKRAFKPYMGLLAACITALGCWMVFRWMHAPVRSTTATIQAVIPAETPPNAPPPSNSGLASKTNAELELAKAQHEIERLQTELNAAQIGATQATASASNSAEQLDLVRSQLVKATADRDAANQQLASVNADAQALRQQVVDAGAVAEKQALRAATLEGKLKDLNSSVEDKDHILALDKEFLSHDRDIRDLIGARDLYIADIYDVAQNGKTAKPFGRVFYTKDRSLVFYGYDLDKQAGLKQAVAFQAWGSGEDKKNVSLGIFYQDDTHKRWVLQFNDTKTLARLNMVFVTAEPQGGSTKPTGKPLLMAYLQVQPNHP